jgi:thymidylate synthase
MWPAFLADQLILGNPNSSIAIVCGWADRDVYLKKLREAADFDVLNRVAAIGNLYSSARGVDMLIRNLLANPMIRTLIFTGPDLSGASGDALSLFADSEGLVKIENYLTLPDHENLRIWNNIPRRMIQDLTSQTSTFRVEGAEAVVGLIEDPPFFKPRECPVTEIAPPKINPPSLPAPDNVHPIRAEEIGPAWLEILYQIMTFGKVIDTHYGEPSRELMNSSR